MTKPIFIDFEASGFGETSYPIEVAWNRDDQHVSSYLINNTEISDWTHWDPISEEKAHRIAQSRLAEEGISPFDICAVMNKELDGKTVYCDAPDHDGFWLMRLFNATRTTPTFKLGSAIDLFYDLVTRDIRGNRTPRDVFNMILDTFGVRAWENIKLPPHRAEPDVRHLLEMHRLLVKHNGKLF